jgi:hypothetical protein
MAKQNWLNRQLDHANSVVRSWSDWKRETIRSQISDVGRSGIASSNSSQQSDTRETDTNPRQSRVARGG